MSLVFLVDKGRNIGGGKNKNSQLKNMRLKNRIGFHLSLLFFGGG